MCGRDARGPSSDRMPEGPEVRKYADALDAVLSGRPITSLEARTRDAKAWLKDLHVKELIH